jgi:hypothetical protein
MIQDFPQGLLDKLTGIGFYSGKGFAEASGLGLFQEIIHRMIYRERHMGLGVKRWS